MVTLFWRHALNLCNGLLTVRSPYRQSIQIKIYFASYLLLPMKHITFLEATSAAYSSCFQNESASSSSSTTDAGQQRCRKHSFENQSVTMHNFSGKFAQSAPKSLLKEWRIWTQLQLTKMFPPWMILSTWRRKLFFQLWLSQVGRQWSLW